MVGEKVGTYQILRLIGEGGMGQVYEAKLQTSDLRVAIKVLRPEYTCDAQMASRFINEARAIEIVKHPGVVAIHDVGTLPSQAPFIAMEYLDGVSLRAHMRKPGSGLTLEIAHQIALTLAEVHTKNIIHRDLKPENVMMLSDAAAPLGTRVKVLDFGIAKWVATSQIGAAVKTRTGVMMGTPTYMAPEQCGGDGEVCDRTDVYALGVILYEMISGRPPFMGDQDAQIIGKHLFKPPTPLEEICPGVDPYLADLTHRMLRKPPTDRPSMQEVAVQLEDIKTGSTAAFGQRTVFDIPLPSPTMRSADPEHNTLGHASGQIKNEGLRRKLFALAAGGSTLLLAIGLLVYSQRTPKPQPQPVPPVPSVPAAAVPAAKIRWNILSTPKGARVIEVGTGGELGRTPLNIERDATATPQQLLLRLDGYSVGKLAMGGQTSETREVVLTLEPRHGAKGSKGKGGKGKSERGKKEPPAKQQLRNEQVPFFGLSDKKKP